MIDKLISGYIDAKVIPKLGLRGYNRMYDKFCIIDMGYIMHGSYKYLINCAKESIFPQNVQIEIQRKFASYFNQHIRLEIQYAAAFCVRLY